MKVREHGLCLFDAYGPNLWGRCECDTWAWLGTYEGPRGRFAKLRKAFREHLRAVKAKA